MRMLSMHIDVNETLSVDIAPRVIRNEEGQATASTPTAYTIRRKNGPEMAFTEKEVEILFSLLLIREVTEHPLDTLKALVRR